MLRFINLFYYGFQDSHDGLQVMSLQL